MTHDHTDAGIKRRTRLATARERLRERLAAHGRTERTPLTTAVGRTLAAPVTADRAVPSEDRAAVDGWAVRADDTVGASPRAPAVLRVGDEVTTGRAVAVDTGQSLPPGADAVVRTERVTRLDEEIEIEAAVPIGGDVVARGEDVTADRRLYETGHRLRPSDLGLLRAVGVDRPTVAEPPTVAVVPTGDELVAADPGPGENVETNGVVVDRLVAQWGGAATVGGVVSDEPDALGERLTRAASADLVVTVGGTAVGSRDHLPAVVDDCGEVVVRGLATEPAHPTTLGVVDDTPVVCLPGYPVACVVAAVQLLRPAVRRLAGGDVPPHPTTRARLARKIPSGPGVRTFAQVRLSAPDDADAPTLADDNPDGETAPRATPTDGGASAHSTVGLADGWVVVPESREGVDAGETVSVERWEQPPTTGGETA